MYKQNSKKALSALAVLAAAIVSQSGASANMIDSKAAISDVNRFSVTFTPELFIGKAKLKKVDGSEGLVAKAEKKVEANEEKEKDAVLGIVAKNTDIFSKILNHDSMDANKDANKKFWSEMKELDPALTSVFKRRASFGGTIGLEYRILELAKLRVGASYYSNGLKLITAGAFFVHDFGNMFDLHIGLNVGYAMFKKTSKLNANSIMDKAIADYNAKNDTAKLTEDSVKTLKGYTADYASNPFKLKISSLALAPEIGVNAQLTENFSTGLSLKYLFVTGSKIADGKYKAQLGGFIPGIKFTYTF